MIPVYIDDIDYDTNNYLGDFHPQDIEALICLVDNSIIFSNGNDNAFIDRNDCGFYLSEGKACFRIIISYPQNDG